ncbi:hypothetical protein Ahy_A09g045507 isoform C [Arachis hypogaea]|uniref:Uncharacterized protein n=1 Tax=Arachis hypogaea TaxID=3818 RepID=A0A445BMF9_ARAHY|nr:hypothetical protein Ahy_A09g045507 isoform C [Arachis hypogaea]
MAISTVSIHIFGDVPSSPLVGILQQNSFPAQDHINDWRKIALCLTSIFFLAAIIWFIGKWQTTKQLWSAEIVTICYLEGSRMF